MDVIFVEEHDPHVNPLGVKGLGEIAMVGVAPAIANASRRDQGAAAVAAPRRSVIEVQAVSHSPLAKATADAGARPPMPS
jgi:hypothetical protein